MASTTVMEGAEAWSATGEGERARVGIAVTHGFTGNPISMRPLAERLHADGFTVELVRLPGHGTTPEDLATTRYADWLAELEATVDDLAARCDQVVLVGFSVGGMLSLDVGARRDIAGLVAINALILDPPGLIPKFAGVLQHVLPMIPAKLAGIAEDDIQRRGVTEAAYPKVSAKAAYSMTRALPRVRGQLSAITSPVLVCSSTVDHTVDPRNSKELVRLLTSARTRFLELPNSYHVAPLDLDQDLLFDTVSEFVAGVTDT